jgi:putative tryptophan/tyrosine transport system substrate-binding protein
MSGMRRRDFITLLGGAAATWPLAARAQQAERMRRIGVLSSVGADDAGEKTRLAAFVRGLKQLGWTAGSNVRIDHCWAEGVPDRIRTCAMELVGLAPDVILATSGTNLPVLLQTTQSVPIVFVRVADPVGAGWVSSLARPGGNATGFIVFEYGIASKWLELLKQIAPNVTRAVVLREPRSPGGIGQFGALQSAAPLFGVELTPADVHDPDEIEGAIAAFANSANGGMIVTGSELAALHRDLIVRLAGRLRLPAVYSDRYFVTGGGLISYGPDRVDQYQLAAGYVDRILKGEKAAELPVQAPTKFELAINLKAAKTIGLTVPDKLLAAADEVIE